MVENARISENLHYLQNVVENVFPGSQFIRNLA